MAYIGNKIAWCDYDDTFRPFKDLTLSPTKVVEGNTVLKSIFDDLFFARCKALHDTYGAKFVLPCFYEYTGYNLSQMSDAWKAEFEANASWLTFTFHSYSTSTIYPDEARIGPTWTNKAAYPGPYTRSQYDDFVLMQTQMQRIVGAAWQPNIIVCHVLHGRRDEMTQIEHYVGHPIVWMASSIVVGHLWDFDMYFDDATHPEYHAGIAADGYYRDIGEGYDRLFIGDAVYPDAGHDDYEGATTETFAGQLPLVPATGRNTFLCISHEQVSGLDGYVPFFQDFCTYINANGYDWRIPDDSFIRTAYSIPASTVSYLPVVTMAVGTPSGLTVPVTLTGNAVVTAYLITESATPPLATDPGWSGIAPTEYTVAAEGEYTLYAWAKDAAGNVSDGSSAAVSVQTGTNGTFSLPSVSLQPVVSAPTLAGFTPASFTLPSLQVQPVIIPPTLAALSASGHSIRSPSGELLDIRTIDGVPIQIGTL